MSKQTFRIIVDGKDLFHENVDPRILNWQSLTVQFVYVDGSLCCQIPAAHPLTGVVETHRFKIEREFRATVDET